MIILIGLQILHQLVVQMEQKNVYVQDVDNRTEIQEWDSLQRVIIVGLQRGRLRMRYKFLIQLQVKYTEAKMWNISVIIVLKQNGNM